MSGFTSTPSLEELSALSRARQIPLYEDLGSGCVVDLRRAGIHEPLVADSFRAGVDLVSFSCDKLLGGPQSGIIAGERHLLERVRRNPLYRTFRVDKLAIEALERTLRLVLFEHWDQIPSIAAILENPEKIEQRARALAKELPGAEVRASESPIGGGSTPEQMLPTWLVELTVEDPDGFSRQLRTGAMPVITRIAKGKVIFDLRTVPDSELPLLQQTVLAALGVVLPDKLAVNHRC
jgi:L-seryl-tRNA(Ser) seleniumtransferase